MNIEQQLQVVKYHKTEGDKRIALLPVGTKTQANYVPLNCAVWRKLPENQHLGSAVAKKAYLNEYVPKASQMIDLLRAAEVAAGRIYATRYAKNINNGSVVITYKPTKALKEQQDKANGVVDDKAQKATKASAEAAARSRSIAVLIDIGGMTEEAAAKAYDAKHGEAPKPEEAPAPEAPAPEAPALEVAAEESKAA